jgi:tetratricopeptide (TPR) repeat protein
VPLEPRFRRVAALERKFVDRDSAVSMFDAELADVGDYPKVLNVVGVGGAGKSRLLNELRKRATKGGCRVASLDLQVPAMRQHFEALAVLRRELGRQGVWFGRFDIGYATLWQRLHPTLKLSARDFPFAGESEALASILAHTVPMFGTAVGLLKLADQARIRITKHHRTKTDEVLHQLDELPNAEMLDAVTYLFAQDLQDASKDQPFAIFIDAFDALVPAPLRAGRSAVLDSWLRDLVAQLHGGIVVMASREPLGWEAYNTEWAEVIHVCEIKGLPVEARDELLTDAGVSDLDQRRTIAAASEGLPFYLHLAIDTHAQSGQSRVDAVSTEELLQRFLQNVDAAEVRCLELLAVPRQFEYEIFKTLAGNFDLPGNVMTWESLTAYSFVYPAVGDMQKLHQLMYPALRQRLSPGVADACHGILRNIWDKRADGGDSGALREALYHLIRTGDVNEEIVLSYADRAFARGAINVVEGMSADLRELLVDLSDTDLDETMRCLVAETAVVMGDAGTARDDNGPQPRLHHPSGARLAIAQAHGLRIGGDTTHAGQVYEAVLRQGHVSTQQTARNFVADVRMWQGDFGAAFTLAQEILDGCGPDDQQLRSDTLRLMHLGYRFLLSFDDSARALKEARDAYQTVGSVVGLANIATNEVELKAWTHPGNAVDLAPAAISGQRRLGALHELGKTYTALAIAHVQLGHHAEAIDAFDEACTYLDRAGYRSGRARAELFRGMAAGIRGDLTSAARSISWAVDEFIRAEVYPNLIVLAARALERLDCPSPAVGMAARDARLRIHPLDSMASLEARTVKLVEQFLGEAG